MDVATGSVKRAEVRWFYLRWANERLTFSLRLRLAIVTITHTLVSHRSRNVCCFTALRMSAGLEFTLA
jgi:hypothetical protein